MTLLVAFYKANVVNFFYYRDCKSIYFYQNDQIFRRENHICHENVVPLWQIIIQKTLTKC